MNCKTPSVRTLNITGVYVKFTIIDKITKLPYSQNYNYWISLSLNGMPVVNSLTGDLTGKGDS
jgi:hypothetical protein